MRFLCLGLGRLQCRLTPSSSSVLVVSKSNPPSVIHLSHRKWPEMKWQGVADHLRFLAI